MISQRIIRVFPRRTNTTPVDDLAYVGLPDMWSEADAVHISVAFTWDLNHAGWLAEQWERIAPVTIGGPAAGLRGERFTPGQYLKPGYVITSRGCPNRCWFCAVPRREGDLRELPVTDGWNVLDDNLLACSEPHIRRVFAMLQRQPHRAEFTGGLEAARLQDWHVELLATLKPKSIFFAYDTPDDYDPLVVAAEKLFDPETGITVASHAVRCYVLIGYPGDRMAAARERFEAVVRLGIMPFAMLWRNDEGATEHRWRKFQREWARPHIVGRRITELSERLIERE